MVDLTIVALAAGKGTRMLSDLPKVMHKVAQQSLIEYVIHTAQTITEKVIIVTSEALQNNIEFQHITRHHAVTTVIQKTPLGTAHAVKETIDHIDSEYTLILCGDVPFLKVSTIQNMCKHPVDLVILGFECDVNNSYGRIVLDENGNPAKIVEIKEANTQEQNIITCNAGVFLIKTDVLKNFLNEVQNDNKSGEYYLTDLVEFVYRHNGPLKNKLIVTHNKDEVMGINDKNELARAEAICQEKLRAALLSNGVNILSPHTVFLTPTTKIKSGSIIHPFVVFGRDVYIDHEVTILPFCHIEGANISKGVTIGPFARIRPKTDVKEYAKIGNFVEVKNSVLGNETKASHLSYIGDATIDEKVNIGAGTIFCNYDGYEKNSSKVGKNSFIGSNSCIISPIEIDADAFVGAGTVVTRDVPANYLAISRADQKNIKRKRK